MLPAGLWSTTQATPLLDGAAAVLVAKPAVTPLVAMGSVTVPGAMLFDCDSAACAVEKKTLTGNEVPLNSADGYGEPPMPPVSKPEEMTLEGFLSIRKRPSPWVPGAAVGLIVTAVAPVAHPLAQVPVKTSSSSL